MPDDVAQTPIVIGLQQRIEAFFGHQNVTWLAILRVSGRLTAEFGPCFLVLKTDIMHIVPSLRANPLKDGGAKPPV
jgi:hypothetical protein